MPRNFCVVAVFHAAAKASDLTTNQAGPVPSSDYFLFGGMQGLSSFARLEQMRTSVPAWFVVEYIACVGNF